MSNEIEHTPFAQLGAETVRLAIQWLEFLVSRFSLEHWRTGSEHVGSCIPRALICAGRDQLKSVKAR